MRCTYKTKSHDFELSIQGSKLWLYYELTWHDHKTSTIQLLDNTVYFNLDADKNIICKQEKYLYLYK